MHAFSVNRNLQETQQSLDRVIIYSDTQLYHFLLHAFFAADLGVGLCFPLRSSFSRSSMSLFCADTVVLIFLSVPRSAPDSVVPAPAFVVSFGVLAFLFESFPPSLLPSFEASAPEPK